MKMDKKLYAATNLYRMVYTAQVKFSLPSTSLKPHEIKAIQSGVITTLPGKNKLPPTYTTVLMFAPYQAMGIEVPEFDFIQGTHKFVKLMAHLQPDESLGKIMHIVMEWYKITTGIRMSVLENTTLIKYCYYPYVRSLRNFPHSMVADVLYPGMRTLTLQS